MKDNLRRLELIFKITRLKPEMFYAISVYSDKIVLQGYFSEALVKMCSSLKLQITSSSSGWIEFHNSNIQITLTAK